MFHRLSDNILFLFLFMLIFGILLYGFIGFDYTDELCALGLFSIFGIYLFTTPHWSFNKSFLFTIGIFIFYICYSFYIRSNTQIAILADATVQIKPYLAFFCIYSMMPQLNDRQKKLLQSVCLLCWIILIPIGIAGAINEQTLRMTMGHPAYFAAAVTCLSLTYLYCSKFSINEKIIFIVMLALGILSGRSKFYGFFTFSFFVIFYFSAIKQFKLNLKNGIILTLMIIVMLFVAWKKIDLYFYHAMTSVDESEKDMIARYVLYATFPQILTDYFPFGSGFASFGTFYSGAYYSNIYVEYGIDNVWGMTKNHYNFVADTFYPSLAQFGIIGILLYLFFWIYILKKAIQYNKKVQNKKYISIALMIIGFFAIEGTTDSTFTTHRGFYVLMLLGLILSDLKNLYIEKTAVDKKAFEDEKISK